MYRIIEVGNQLCLSDEAGRIIEKYEKFAFAVERNFVGGIQFTMHKFGEQSEVEQWVKTATEQFRSAGLDNVADNIFVLTETPDFDWCLDDINWALECTGGIKRLIEKSHAITVN